MSERNPEMKDCRAEGITTPWGHARGRGFTLIELLVVLAVTAVLMVMLFVPLSRSLDLTQRGNATAKGQDDVRDAMRRVSRELANAMEVLEPRDLQLWGYSQWDLGGRRPRPAAGAPAESYLARNALVAFRPPKLRYYCTGYSHYVTDADMDAAFGQNRLPDEAIAMDVCPRLAHQDSKVELRALSPLEPSTRTVAYFIGLKNPGLRDAGGRPAYDNLLLFRVNALASYPAGWPRSGLNTYVLYRAEFDPRGVAGVNDGNGNNLDDRWETFLTDPGFFYDTTQVTVGSQQMPRWQWWQSIAVSAMDAETADVVKWVKSGNKLVPHPLVTFDPSLVTDENAQPNREIGKYALGGSALPPDIGPTEFRLDHGHWLGWPAAGVAASGWIDGRTVVPDSLVITNADPGSDAKIGPRIQVLQGGSTPAVFDSQDPTRRHRLLAYDALTGRVIFSIPRLDAPQTSPRDDPKAEYYSADRVEPDPANAGDIHTVDLTRDTATYNPPYPMPASFGAAKAWEAQAPALRGGLTLITPGSEEVYLVPTVASDDLPQAERLRRAGWTGLGTGSDVEPEGALQPDEYVINYRTGRIKLSEEPEAVSKWATVPTNYKLLVRYSIQTSQPGDVVRVSYSTKELFQVNLGIVEYTRRRGESLPFEVSERIVVRNMRR